MHLLSSNNTLQPCYFPILCSKQTKIAFVAQNIFRSWNKQSRIFLLYFQITPYVAKPWIDFIIWFWNYNVQYVYWTENIKKKIYVFSWIHILHIVISEPDYEMNSGFCNIGCNLEVREENSALFVSWARNEIFWH